MLRLRIYLRRWLLSGLLITVPVVLSLSLLTWFVRTLDRMIAPPVERALGHVVPGLGLATGLALVLAAGALGSNYAGRYVLAWTDALLERIPVFSWLYRTFKQVMELFAPEGKLRFQRVVLVEYPSPGRYSLAFVTRELKVNLPGRGPEDFLCVYVPANHMHFGQSVLVRPSEVVPTGLPLQQGVQGVMSAGASLPDRVG